MITKITYRNKSSDDYGLLYCTFEPKNELESGLSRTVTKGSINEHRFTPSYSYAVYDNSFSFQITFIQKNESAFSKSQIRTINKWLTGSRYSSELICTTGNDETIYKGVFTGCQYKTGSTGVIGLIYTFENDSPFAYKRCNLINTITEPTNISINCDSDCDENYIYPKISITPASSYTTFILTNTSDNNNHMNITLKNNTTYVIDCQNQIITNNSFPISFEDIGWDYLDDIYWLRLINGNNIININLPCDINISYLSPIKAGEIYDY